MKQMSCLLVLVLAVSQAWAARKITVEELRTTLASMHQQNKSDAEVANALKQLN